MSNIAQEYAAALRTAGGSLEQLTESAAYLTAHEALWEALCSPAVEAHEKTAVLARLPEFLEEIRCKPFMSCWLKTAGLLFCLTLLWLTNN